METVETTSSSSRAVGASSSNPPAKASSSYAATNSSLQRVSRSQKPESTSPARRGSLLNHRNEDLVKALDDLRANRDELDRIIHENQEELEELEAEIEALQERHRQLSDYMARRQASRDHYQKTIDETNAAYNKILESSQNLLSVLKQEGANLSRDFTGVQLEEKYLGRPDAESSYYERSSQRDEDERE